MLSVLPGFRVQGHAVYMVRNSVSLYIVYANWSRLSVHGTKERHLSYIYMYSEQYKLTVFF